ncbi:MAG: lysostaphin resistance A-like protein [Promethearchaeota archaeon]
MEERTPGKPGKLQGAAVPRVYLVLEVAGVLLVQLVAVSIVALFFPLEASEGPYASFYLYLTVSVAVSVAIPFVIAFISKFMLAQTEATGERGGEQGADGKSNAVDEQGGAGRQGTIDVAIDPFRAFAVKRGEVKDQLAWTALLLLVVFIPLDFSLYMFPGFLEYSAEAIVGARGGYLQSAFVVFLGASFLTHSCVAYHEELTYRGFCLKRGADYFRTESAVVVSALFFGLGHFNYYFTAAGSQHSVLYPLTWSVVAAGIGLVLGAYFSKTRHLLPLVVAHALNNVISTLSLWNYIHFGNILNVAYYVYLPALGLGVLVVALNASRVRAGVRYLLELLRRYFSRGMLVYFLDACTVLVLWLVATVI